MPSWKIGEVLRAQSIEDLAQSWSKNPRLPKTVSIDLQGFRSSLPLADARLMGLLVHLRRLGAEIRLEVSTNEISIGVPSGSVLRTLFTEDLAGLSLLTFAGSVRKRNGSEIRNELEILLGEAMQKTSGELRHPDRITFLARDSRPKLGPPPEIDYVIQGHRHAFDLNLITKFIKHFSLPGLDTEMNLALNDFVWEMLRNTQDHGSIGGGSPRAGLRYLDVRKFTRRALSLRSSKLGMSDYLASVGRQYPAAPLVEITIADSGPGIAATMSGGFEVYSKSPGFEKEITELALTRSGSSKRSGDPDVGFGLDRAMEVCSVLNGLMFIRTGRFEFSKSGLDGSAREGKPGITARERALIGGTAVSMVIPWVGSLPTPIVGE